MFQFTLKKAIKLTRNIRTGRNRSFEVHDVYLTDVTLACDDSQRPGEPNLGCWIVYTGVSGGSKGRHNMPWRGVSSHSAIYSVQSALHKLTDMRQNCQPLSFL